jgi:hypothetical protein
VSAFRNATISSALPIEQRGPDRDDPALYFERVAVDGRVEPGHDQHFGLERYAAAGFFGAKRW